MPRYERPPARHPAATAHDLDEGEIMSKTIKLAAAAASLMVLLMVSPSSMSWTGRERMPRGPGS